MLYNILIYIKYLNEKTMAPIKFKHVVSFTSEDKNFPAENLVNQETYRKWKCAEPGEKQASVTIQLEKSTYIHSIDIGNEGSAFVEVLVNRSDSKDQFQVLLLMSSFMSPAESASGSNLNRVRMFGPNHLSQTTIKEKWDCVKIVCTQPFNKNIKYGLSFIRLHSPPEKPPDTEAKTTQSIFGIFKMKDEDPSETFKPGGLFAKRKATDQPLKGAAAIRAASAAAESSLNKQSDLTSRNSKSPEASSSQMRVKARDNITKFDDPSTSQSKESSPALSRHKQKEEKIKAAVKKQTSVPISDDKSQSSSSLVQKDSKPKLKLEKSGKNLPYEKIMKGVVFTLSGYQNPYRSQLRDTALAMGAKYRPDWDSQCTHLICAFVNTPKYIQVQGKGGKIVSKEWILDCDKQKKLLNWKKYRLDGGSSEESDDTLHEVDEEEDMRTSRKRTSSPAKAVAAKIQRPSPSSKNNESSDILAFSRSPAKAGQQITPKKGTGTVLNVDSRDSDKTINSDDDDEMDKYSGSTEVMSSPSPDVSSDTEDEIRRIREKEAKNDANDIYDADTDEDDFSEFDTLPDTSQLPLPVLPDIFTGKFFFLYGKFDDLLRRRINRNIVAYNGKIENYMSEKVSVVVTQSKWDNNFDEALSENSHLVFLRPQWIFACAKKGMEVAHKPYIVSPAAD